MLQAIQKLDPEFPVQYALCLSYISMYEGLSITDLAEKTGMPLSTVSRIISALSQNKTRNRSYDLVDIVISPHERRRKLIYLNKRGQKFVSDINDTIENIKHSTSAVASVR
nr:helix-turn-helix domain-containing protein [Cytophagales bacterium]